MPERIEIIVTTDAGEAAGTLDQLAAQVEDLTGIRPEITVEAATDEAAEGLDTVAEGADELDGAAAAVEVSAPGASDAIADIESVAGAAQETASATAGIGDAAVTSAGSVKGATKDMLRPLGMAKSQVSDLTDTFQLLADQAVEKLQLSEAQVGKLASALPVIGVAIGLAVTAWTSYSDAQKKAAEDADRARDAFREVGDALAAGDIEDAADRFVSANEEVYASAEDLGIPYQELADYITGAADTIPSLEGRTGELGSATADMAIQAQGARDTFQTAGSEAGQLGDKTGTAQAALGTYAEGLGGAAEAAAELAGYVSDVNEQLDQQKSALDVTEGIDQLEQAMIDAYTATAQFGVDSEEAHDANNNLRGSMIDAKQDVIDYAEEVGGIPPATITEILAMIDRGDLAAAEAAMAALERDRYASVFVKMVPTGARWAGGGFTGSGYGRAAEPEAGSRAAAPAALAVAPQITVRVDARGAVDPYSVGRAVEHAAGAWGRVSGRWRPGLRGAA